VFRSRFLQASALALGLSLQAQAAPTVQVLNGNITQAEVIAAQKGWCQGLLKISAAYASGGFSKAKATAEAVIDQGYAYQFGPVAFKPTLASGSQTFRATRAGALAYFVGGDPGDFQERCRRWAPIQAACWKSKPSSAVVSSVG